MKQTNSSRAGLFTYTLDEMKQIASDAVAYGRAVGAAGVAVDVLDGNGRDITVRQGEMETIQSSHETTIRVSVYDGQRVGHARTGDFSQEAIKKTISSAFDVARFVGEDRYSGLPDVEDLEMQPIDLDLLHIWDIPPSDAAALARAAEDAAFRAAPSVCNVKGSYVRSSQFQRVFATSNGFLNGFGKSVHSLSCAPIAGAGDDMQGGSWATYSVDAHLLESAEVVGALAGRRAASHVGARKLATCRVPVLFESTQAVGLLQAFVQATSGVPLYRRATFLADSLGTSVFANHVQITEDPHLRGGLGSAPFDSEGVRTRRRTVVGDGVVREYFLSSYSARKLGMRTTGSADGAHNLSLSSSLTGPGDDLEGMLRRLGTGVFVTDMMGQGINIVTGGYSRGASGFWVENGVIQYPVHEITVAGTLQDMFKSLVAIGNDVYRSGSMMCGSLLIEGLTVAGS
ncbi:MULTISPECIES: metallopeptidase TldD-related protein [Paraburkholderia]|uniref:metallopeptidase TldD-related protein n=1 Tax=Paraburkholderia TaxID=1822464 RepID=UPI002AB1712B|nr:MULTISPECIES: metallopeptidase TldD-related protein [Paraburkholderia]